MVTKIPTKRKYNSSRRKAQAIETHTQILEAAQKLFINRGYGGTSIESIAQEAGVALETVYSVFGNKRTILSRVFGLSIGEDDNPIPLVARSYMKEVEAERNQNRQIQMFAKRIQIIMANLAPILEVMRSAAKTEPEIAGLLRKFLDGKFQGMGYFIDCIVANGPLRKELNRFTATETVWMLTSAEVYTLLVVDRGWSSEEYTTWLAETLIRLLLP